MKCVRNILIYTLNVMIQVSVIAFKNTWENWGNYFVFHEKICLVYFSSVLEGLLPMPAGTKFLSQKTCIIVLLAATSFFL
jgi:hypothetical protein